MNQSNYWYKYLMIMYDSEIIVSNIMQNSFDARSSLLKKLSLTYELVYTVEPGGDTVTGVRESPPPSRPRTPPAHHSELILGTGPLLILTYFFGTPHHSQTLCQLTEL